ncbi:MAG TPA: 50S ribosomal protein L9 [Rhodospirillaceae bacterium]|nr:50S ribosomal protein L9 [Rhodospirillaceae bacterium]
MQVVLLERVEKLGQIGDVVDVKAGFARNFLLPQNKALRATKDNIAYFESQKSVLLAANAERRTAAETEAKKLDGQKFVLLRQASEVGILFGSVNARDVADAAAENGYNIQRAHVRLDQGIKTLGIFDVKIQPHPEVTVSVTINIARSKEEAAEQFKTGQAVIRQGGEAVKAGRGKDKSAESEVDAAAFFEAPPVELTAETSEESAA